MIIRGALAFSLLLGMSSLANAAGLGKLTVNSALGQILNAEIDLVSLQPGELDALNARVATPEAFRDARIEYGPSLRLLRFSVEKRANGQPYLKITSVGSDQRAVRRHADRGVLARRPHPARVSDPAGSAGLRKGNAANSSGGSSREPPRRQPAGHRAGGFFSDTRSFGLGSVDSAERTRL